MKIYENKICLLYKQAFIKIAFYCPVGLFTEIEFSIGRITILSNIPNKNHAKCDPWLESLQISFLIFCLKCYSKQKLTCFYEIGRAHV